MKAQTDTAFVLSVLRERGSLGATTSYLLSESIRLRGFPFNRVSARIHDLRQQGYAITCERAGTSSIGRPLHVYTLHEQQREAA